MGQRKRPGPSCRAWRRPALRLRSQAGQSDLFHDGVRAEWIEHLHFASSHVIDVARHQHKPVDARGRGQRPVAHVLALRSKQARPLGHHRPVDRYDTRSVGGLERIQLRELGRGKFRIAPPSSLPPSPLLEKGHDADAHIACRNAGMPSQNMGVPSGPEFAQHILVKQVNRHGMGRGAIVSSSLSMSHTPDSAMSLSIRLKLRGGRGRPGFG